MAMSAGDDTAAAGTMAGAIFTALESHLGASTTPAFEAQRKKLAAAIASGVVSHLAAHADVRITTATAGLQRDAADALPTLAPTSDVVIAGALE